MNVPYRAHSSKAPPVLYAPHMQLEIITVLRMSNDLKSSSAYQLLIPAVAHLDVELYDKIVAKGRKLTTEEALRIWPDAPGYRE